MRIDSSFANASQLAAPIQKETAAEVENDGDSDDGAKAVSRQQSAQAPQQSWGMWTQGVGSKIDVMA
jgi:hypothetical protein